MEKNYFIELNNIDVSAKVEKKNNLSYLSWAWAWGELKKLHPSATYTIKKFGESQLPYVYDDKTGYMVFTEMTIENTTHEMWLPVMDGANKAMKKEKYSYFVAKKQWDNATRKYIKVGEEEKFVEPADMFDINKTLMRCIVKNIAMFGLGLYIYAGEDLPENTDQTNYNDKLKQLCKDSDLDLVEIAKEYKLNAKTSNERFKEVYLELGGE